jgi:hypothetical protein
MWRRFTDCLHYCGVTANNGMDACGDCPHDPEPCLLCIDQWGAWHDRCLDDCDQKYQDELYDWWCSHT